MQEMKHSGLGIASLVTSIVSGILIFLTILVAGVIESSTPGGMDEQSPEAMAVGLFLFTFLGLALISFGLGIAGLFQKDRKKTTSVLGTVFSGVTVIGTVFILLLGLAMS